MKHLFTLQLVAFLLLSGHSLFGQESNNARELTVLYTNDEHGWMEGMSPGQGAANLYRLWQEQEGFSEDGPFLVLSGGDNWTGPAISTWVQGESMVDVMNAMSYDASAVGNHEFDFGLEVLRQRATEADFPYLGANIAWKENGRVPEDLGILPYTIIDKLGVKIGIIGLTTTSTPFVTTPTYVRDLEFTDYGEAVRRTLPALAGTDLQFIIAHVCMEEMEVLVREISDLGIDLAGGGHCNELSARKIGDTIVLGGGYHFTSYATATFLYDPTQDRYVGTLFDTHQNRGADADSPLSDIIAAWGEESADILRETVAFNATRLDVGGVLDQLIIDSWLVAFPDADIAITNRGGIRTALPAGEVTVSDIVNILPFDNTIISLQVPGNELEAFLENPGRNVVAGVSRQGNGWRLAGTGTKLAEDGIYTVLVNSFMYAGGDNTRFNENRYPGGFDTGMSYRQPFVDWLKVQGSTARVPLNLQ